MARRKKHEEHENHERWLVSYADFITLLFAFFVVMYATSSSNVEKQQKFEDSIRLNLRLGMGGGQGEGSNSSGIDEAIGELEMPIGGFPAKGGSKEAADFVARYMNKKVDEKDRKETVQGVYSDAVGVKIALAASTFFPAGSSKLKLSSLAVLDKVAEILKQTDKRLIIEGHTDDTPINDPAIPSNWELAGQRASSVIRYFIKYHQMDPKRFTSISYADLKPVAPNDTEEHRALNRRIEIMIVTDEKSATL
jgi:Flagellar motor protein